MTAEPSDSGEGIPNGIPPPVKRGRGRPKGSVKNKLNMFQRKLTRVPKVVESFSATAPKEQLRKRGRPKKRLRGRPRKTQLSAEEEAERRTMQQLKPRRRRLWKPLGRPRIYPLVPPTPQGPRKRGSPPKYDSVSSRSTSKLGNPPANRPPVKRGRGRPPSSTNKTRRLTFSPVRKRGRPPGSGKDQAAAVDGPPRKRGRPRKRSLEEEADSPPRKRGRPRSSGSAVAKKKLEMENGATPKKRGRPRGSLGKKKRHWKATIPEPKPLYDGPPRKRGRPSKVKPTDLPSSSEKAEQPQEEQPQEKQPQEEQPQEEQPKLLYDGPPRKRGRPSKVKPTDLPSSSEKAEQPQEEQPLEEQPQEKQPQEEQPQEKQPQEEQPQEEQPKLLYDGPPRKRGRPSKVKPTDLPSSSEKAEQPQEEQPQEEQPQEEQPQEEQPQEEQPQEEQPQEEQQPQEQPHEESIQAASAANGNTQPASLEEGHDRILAPVEDEDELLGGDEGDAAAVEEKAVGKGSSSGKKTPVAKRGGSSRRLRAV